MLISSKTSRRELEKIATARGLVAERYSSKEQLINSLKLLDKLVSTHRMSLFTTDSIKHLSTREVEVYAASIELHPSEYTNKKELLAAIEDRLQFLRKCPTTYRYQRELGNGTTGQVYAVEKDGCMYAVKSIPHDDVLDNGIYEGGLTESNILLYTHHPNILHALDVRWEGGESIELEYESPYLYLIQPLAEEDLHAWLLREHSLEEKIGVLAGIVDGLSFLHRNRILHADLKPENIVMLGGKPALGDFNLSEHLLGQKLTTTIVTEPWRPPEVFTDQPHTLAVDIWSLGILMWDIFGSGGILFPPPDIYDKILEWKGTEVSFQTLVEGVVRNELERLCRRCLQWEAGDRISIEEVAQSFLFREYIRTTGTWSIRPYKPIYESRNLPIIYNGLYSACKELGISMASLSLAIDLYERYIVEGSNNFPDEEVVIAHATLSLVTHITENTTFWIGDWIEVMAKLRVLPQHFLAIQSHIMYRLQFQLILPDTWLSCCPDTDLHDLVIRHYAMRTLPSPLLELYRDRRFTEVLNHPLIKTLPPLSES